MTINDAMREDSRKLTIEHIEQVGTYMAVISDALLERASVHDESKLHAPEIDLFAEWGPKLKNMEYGSDEYKEALQHMGVALKHHYENNRHHPEFFKAPGINGMNLIDLIEMVCDWKAASLRMKDGGDIGKSLEVNKKRFHLDSQLFNIIVNTMEFFEEKEKEKEND